jgi:hypothetical protein
MTGDAAPRPEPGTDAQDDGGEYVPVRRDTLETLTEMLGRGHDHDERLRAVAYQQGRDTDRPGGYETGFTLGHDTGYSARQDTRGYVHGILDGFAAGTQARHQLAAELLRGDRPYRAADRQPGREAEAS